MASRYGGGITSEAALAVATMGTETNMPVGPQTPPKKATKNKIVTGCIRKSFCLSTNFTSMMLENMNFKQNCPANANIKFSSGRSKRPSNKITGTGKSMAAIVPTSGTKLNKKVIKPNTIARSTPKTSSNM
mmetsp:Transcript_86300/g.240260  ORF Transcript_86300/g.240260 Transcript_86300/m.240260 type:complete len:131 (-) Transcript_86300:312-704(-)